MNTAARLMNKGIISRDWVITFLLSNTQVMFAGLMTAVIISALGVVFASNTTRNLNADFQQSVIEQNHLQIQWGQLLLEKGTLIMQARIQHVAEKQLGMQVPDNQSVVVVNE
jgi:cell division protein FtsL